MPDKVLLKIGAVDFTPYLKNYKLDYNVLVKDTGRNAKGNLTISVINTKAKIHTVFRPMDENEMAALLTAMKPFVYSIQYWDTETKTQKTGTFYNGTPSSDMFTNRNQTALYNDFEINFIEL